MHLLLFMTRGMSLSSWKKNGSLSRELALYEKMAERGVRTSIISWGGKEEKIIARRYPWLRIYSNFFNLPISWYERLMPLLHALPLIWADLVKSNQTNGGDLALRCARFWQKPFVARCGYVWSINTSKEDSQNLAKVLKIERDVFSQADIAIATSRAATEYLADTHSLSSGFITCIPNYVCNFFYKAPLPDYENRTPQIVTQVGRLAPEKNLFNLVEACSGIGVVLRLIGNGPEREALQAHAEKCQVRVEFILSVAHDALPQILTESTVCALVSNYEGHPKALIEYMAVGCPVLATNVQGNNTVIEHMKTGLLCGTDAQSIREGLKSLLGDALLREKLGKNAKEAARKYTLAEIVEKELREYGRLPRLSLVQKLVAAAKSLLKFSKRRFIKNPEKLSIDRQRFCTDLLERINEFINGKKADEALRVLFSIEQQMYPLQGKLSVAYDGGLHTKHRHTRYHDFFIDRIGKGEKILDIGCGNGFLAYDIAMKSQAVVTGIELNGKNIAIARTKFAHPNVEYIQGNALTDIKGGVYDTIILSNVLEHLPGRVSFLANLRKRLRPRRFLLRVPLFERDWRVPLKKELGLDWRLDPTHETEYSYEDFAYEVTTAGLAITYKEFRWGEIWCEASDGIPYAATPPQEPVITVLMAACNDEAYVAEAVTSILRQTERNFIFLIIDDASTDRTGEILHDFAQHDARIRIFRNDSRRGLTASLNWGLGHIDTPYIARMDADDLALPERFERQLAYMETHPAVAAAGSRILFLEENAPDNPPRAWNMPTSPAVIRERTLSMEPQISHPSSFIRTSALKEVGGYREQFTTAQDYDLWLRLLEKFELGNAPETLLLYRCHENAVSHARVLDQAVNHVLAMRSSELRKEGMADLWAGRELNLSLLFDVLDHSRPSFWAWIRLLARRPVPDKAALLVRTLRLVPRLDEAPCQDFMLSDDWKSINVALASAGNLSHEPRYREICIFTHTLGSGTCPAGEDLC